MTTPVNTGPGALSVTAVAAGNAYAYSDLFPVVPGQTYTVDAVVRAASTVRSSFVRLRWFNAARAEVTTSTGTASNNTTSFAARTVTAVAPASAATVRAEVQFSSAALGEVHYVDNVSLVGGSAAWAGMSDGQTVNWRVQARDGAGLWSTWSEPVPMTRRVKPTVTISNLGAGAAYDSSPPIIWSVTGGTQVRYRVLVYHVTDLSRPVYDSKERQSSETSLTIPSGYLFDDWTYRVKVRVWDSQNREATPGDPTYAQAQADFHLDTDVAVGGVTGLSVAQVGQTPTVDIEWQRSTTPDRFVILRDGRISRTVDAEDVYVSGTTYRYRSHGSRPNWSHRYEVRAVVNGRTSATNPDVYYAVPVEGIWLIDRDRDINVTLMGNDEGTWSMEDDASVYTPIGSTQPVRIVNGMRGLEGVSLWRAHGGLREDLPSHGGRPLRHQGAAVPDGSAHRRRHVLRGAGRQHHDLPVAQDARGRGLQERLVRLLAGGGPPLRRRRLTVRSPAPHDDSRAHHRGAEGVRSGPPLLAHAAHRR
ncbi:hypothetical protein [Promicromonospora kroppenstedtii]|uniref:hypothetical protein n=1 Tax=Promicromonospora kroppenstedtii TaxID=440482 RepID=UPI0004AF8E32|nr:hypothetical protein [Promicromonospora kroppenstedtii]